MKYSEPSILTDQGKVGTTGREGKLIYRPRTNTCSENIKNVYQLFTVYLFTTPVNWVLS